MTNEEQEKECRELLGRANKLLLKKIDVSIKKSNTPNDLALLSSALETCNRLEDNLKRGGNGKS